MPKIIAEYDNLRLVGYDDDGEKVSSTDIPEAHILTVLKMISEAGEIPEYAGSHAEQVWAEVWANTEDAIMELLGLSLNGVSWFNLEYDCKVSYEV